ncbi:MAG: hypothetical protein ACLQT5_15990 [Steroidobacteraceae bacterium]|jgi:hypothetical protein
MALMMGLGPQTTVEPGVTLNVFWNYPDKKDHGPNYLSAQFVARWANPEIATLQTSVYSNEGHDFVYSAQLRNVSGYPAIILFDLGNFE